LQPLPFLLRLLLRLEPLRNRHEFIVALFVNDLLSGCFGHVVFFAELLELFLADFGMAVVGTPETNLGNPTFKRFPQR
jgi:hypothetical protein